ncbi:MFS transporter [Paenibacillus sp. 598K]|uniref:MFS transporter n=1 Tax=Paenibacillus sp. 598K TaxID=1117987 RepID=UPI001C883F5E|nr:MFS transporter [Paenibacillus sp. 598K]
MTRIWNRRYTAIFLMNAVLNISFYMISTTLSVYLTERGMTVATAGALIGAMPLAAMLIRPFSGWICDQFSSRKLLLIFLTLNGLCIAAYGAAVSDVAYLIVRLLHGVSFSITTTVTMALVASSIPRERMGEGLGYFGMGQTLAMALGPGAGLALAHATGPRLMFFFASLCVIVSLISLLFLPDAGEERADRPKRLQWRWGDFFVKQALLFSIISFALSSANGIETSYIALYGLELGLANAGWYFTLSAVTLLLTRMFCGKLVDRKGFSYVLYPGLACVALALLLLSGASAYHAATIFAVAAVLKAIGVGAVQPALQAAVMHAVPPERRGAATSTFYIGADLGQASAPVIAGDIVDNSGYEAMFRVYMLPLAAVMAGYGLVMRIRRRRMTA